PRPEEHETPGTMRVPGVFVVCGRGVGFGLEGRCSIRLSYRHVLELQEVSVHLHRASRLLCPLLCPGRAAMRAVAAFRSSGATMWYRSNTLRVLCPVIIIASFSGVPSLTMSHTAVRRKSWRRLAGEPPRFRGVPPPFRKPFRSCP